MPEIDNKSFISIYAQAYKKGLNQTWVAAQLKVTPAAVSAKKKKLIQSGVQLPQLNAVVSTQELDPTELNNFLQESLRTTSEG